MELAFHAEFYPCGVPEGRVVKVGEPTTREAIVRMQGAAEGALKPEERIDIDERTGHYFAPGLYAREFRLKAGEWVIGKIHKHAHLITLVHGDVVIVDEFDNVRMVGPKTWVSTPGVKRAVYAHTDTLFLTFHPTDETDLEKIEEYVIAPSYEALNQFLLERAS